MLFQVPELYDPLTSPVDGVIIHGLFIDAGRWDPKVRRLVDPNPGKPRFFYKYPGLPHFINVILR